MLRFHKRDRGKIPSIAGEWQKWKLFDNPYFCHPPRNIFPFYHSPRKNIFPFAKSTEGSSFPWQGQRRLQAQYPVARGPACSLFGQGQVDTPNSRCKFAIFSKLRRGDSILVRAGRRTLTFACVYVFSREEVHKNSFCTTTLHSTHLALRLLIFKTLDASEVLIKPFITQRHKTENSLFLNDTQRLFERE